VSGLQVSRALAREGTIGSMKWDEMAGELGMVLQAEVVAYNPGFLVRLAGVSNTQDISRPLAEAIIHLGRQVSAFAHELSEENMNRYLTVQGKL